MPVNSRVRFGTPYLVATPPQPIKREDVPNDPLGDLIARIAGKARLPEGSRIQPPANFVMLESGSWNGPSSHIEFSGKAGGALRAIAIDRPARHARQTCEFLDCNEPWRRTVRTSIAHLMSTPKPRT